MEIKTAFWEHPVEDLVVITATHPEGTFQLRRKGTTNDYGCHVLAVQKLCDKMGISPLYKMWVTAQVENSGYVFTIKAKSEIAII